MSTSLSRVTRMYRIAELLVRFKPERDAKSGKWHVLDAEKGERITAEYTDEAMASAGARLTTACEIDALYDVVKP